MCLDIVVKDCAIKAPKGIIDTKSYQEAVVEAMVKLLLQVGPPFIHKFMHCLYLV